MIPTTILKRAYTTALKLALACAILLPAPFAAAQTPALYSATSEGTINTLTLKVILRPLEADVGKPYSVYIAAKRGENMYYFSSAGSWHQRPATGLVPYLTTNALPDIVTAIVSPAGNIPPGNPSGGDLTDWVGAHFYIGYGTSETEMVDRKRFRLVYTATPDANFSKLEVKSTDSGILYKSEDNHIVRDCAPSDPPCAGDRLFVFLPGSNGSPLEHLKIAQEIGKTGVRVIVLAYQNLNTLHSMCGTNDSCYDVVRRARVEGIGVTNTNVIASERDGIKNRLLKALQKLQWTQFYSGDTIQFNRIIFGGHSQGAGMAAWIGKHYTTARVCQFSGTWDNTGAVGASWLSGSSMTPVGQFYGFTHRHDTFPDGYQYLERNWKTLNMDNDGSLSSTALPLTGKKIVALELDTPLNCVPDKLGHACSSVDYATPVETDGSARYAAAWRYVCGRTIP